MIATATTTNTNHSEDVPFRVQDRRRYSFFIMDNEIVDDYACLIGLIALGVYNVLSRFANQDGVCFPSLNTIARKLGISKPSVIKGLEVLIAYGLIAKEHRFNDKGEHISNLYILLPIKKLPVLSADNGGNQETPEVAEVVNEVDQGGKQHLPGGSKSHLPPSKRDLPEQDSSYNKTQMEQDIQQQEHQHDTKKAESDKAVVVALIDLGISQNVAEFLAGQYAPEKITEKMDYLAFLTAQQPERVKNPCGWLRTAIVDDYAKPDGFVPQTEKNQTDAAEHGRAEDTTPPEPTLQEKIKAEQEAAILKLREEHGTTDEDIAFWESAKQEISWTTPAHISELLVDGQILRIEDDTVVIGVRRKQDWRQLQHPGTQVAIKRALTYVAGREVGLDVREVEKGIMNE